ncbi:hypothetical protein [Acinetobacter pittii]|uniref:hypothetical protein n=1 Tax=Acinetobacter pittii TaxID=48296 RepID=UPI0039F59426
MELHVEYPTPEQVVRIYETFINNGSFFHNELTDYTDKGFEQIVPYLDSEFRKLGYRGARLALFGLRKDLWGTVVWIEDPALEDYETNKELIDFYIEKKIKEHGITF